MHGLEPALAVLDRRLSKTARRPVAVAFSGGGDSTALLLLARTWAAARGRAVLALTVDHQIQPQSAAWTRHCAGVAQALGAGFQALAWTGDKPDTGLPGAARRARHALLADAARQAGADVILMGHTGGDLAEAAVMRAAGSTVGDPREWAPSPVWPQGRGLFLLRPLLAFSRGQVRDWLAGQGAGWIEDPANHDVGSMRAQARAQVGEGAQGAASCASFPGADAARFGAWGQIALPLDVTQAALAAAILCASGQETPPRAASLHRLLERMGEGALTATLAGARITATPQGLSIHREAGEAGRGGLAPVSPAPPGSVWDGRFEIVGGAPAAVRAAGGVMARLGPDDRARLNALPAALRPSLPVLASRDGGLRLARAGEAAALAPARFRAACGLVTRETD